MPSPRIAVPPNDGRQPIEGGGGNVDDEHLVTGLVVGLGDGCADSAASDDDDLHVDSSVIGSRTTHTVHGAFWRMYGNGLADREFATKSLAIRQPDDQQVGGPLGRLVDDRGRHVTRLEEDRLERHLVVLGDRLGRVEHALDLLRAARDVGVER